MEENKPHSEEELPKQENAEEAPQVPIEEPVEESSAESQVDEGEREIEESLSREKRKRNIFEKIVSGFVYFWIVIFGILLITFGFTQTATFRELLRENLVEILNGEFRGTISIGKIEGTIFTALRIKDVLLTYKKDTVVYAGKLEVKVSPHELLAKRIKVRSLLLENVKFNMIQEKGDSLYTLEKALPEPSPDEDTTKSSFPFIIVVDDAELSNIKFVHRTSEFSYTHSARDTFIVDDLLVDSLNFAFSASADIDGNKFGFDIDNLSFTTNVTSLGKTELSGKIDLSTENISIEDLILRSNRTFVEMNAVVSDLNIFESFTDKQLSSAPIDIEIRGDSFSMNDLSLFLPDLSFMKGIIEKPAIQFSGNLESLNVEEISLTYGSTKLALQGELTNLMDVDKFLIDVGIIKSELHYADVGRFMPSLSLPQFPGLQTLFIDTLSYKGKPENFTGVLLVRTGEGSLRTDYAMDFRTDSVKYMVKGHSSRFPLTPFTGGFPVILNALDIDIKGTEFDPAVIDVDITLDAPGSTIGIATYNELVFTMSMPNDTSQLSLMAQVNGQELEVYGSLLFRDLDNPLYELEGYTRDLDIAVFIPDTSTISTAINSHFKLRGNSFDVRNLSAYAEIELMPSKLDTLTIPKLHFETEIVDFDSSMTVSVSSDLFDMKLAGEFNLLSLSEQLGENITIITELIQKKVDQFVGENELVQEVLPTTLKTQGKKQIKSEIEEQTIPETIAGAFTLEFKDLSPIQPFLQGEQLDIRGSMAGTFSADANEFKWNTKGEFRSLSLGNADSALVMLGGNAEINVHNTKSGNSIENLKSDISIFANKIFLNVREKTNTLDNIKLITGLTNGVLSIRAEGAYAGIAAARLNIDADMTEEYLSVMFNKVDLKYKKLVLTNPSPFEINLWQEHINFNNVVLNSDSASVEIDGYMALDGVNQLSLKLKGFELGNLLQTLSDSTMAQSATVLYGKLSAEAEWSGTATEPTLSATLGLTEMKYDGVPLGNLKATLNYADKLIVPNIVFTEITDVGKVSLLISGVVPYNLSISADGERFSETAPIDLRLDAKSFDLTTISDMVPFMKKLTGSLNAGISLQGIYPDVRAEGFATITNSTFVFANNNLKYGLGAKVRLQQDVLHIDSLIVLNTDDVEQRGAINGTGTIELDNYNIATASVLVGGNLTVLDEESRLVTPLIYGPLFIETDGNLILTKTRTSDLTMKANINVLKGNLTFPPVSQSYAGSSRSFIYKYSQEQIEDTLETQLREILTRVSTNGNNSASTDTIKKSGVAKPTVVPSNFRFNYSIGVKLRDDAFVTFIFSKENNFFLSAELAGDVLYEMYNGVQSIQGEIKLLDDSKLELLNLKTLQADGSIRFERDLTNPYLNIVATYRSYFDFGDANENLKGEQEVAVKIKLKGALDKLAQNFVEQEDNVAVYTGTTNISNDVSSTLYDKTDAIYFMALGRFKDQSSASSSNSAVTGTATSVAGSLLGGLLNNFLGDYVRSVEIRQSATAGTKIQFSGKWNKLRYWFGGSTEVFSDFSSASFRLEYPLYDEFIMRLERKEESSGVTNQSQIYNELGLKYRFEF